MSPRPSKPPAEPPPAAIDPLPPPSRFLPPDFDRHRPLAIIAGRGDYPGLVAAAARSAGVPVRLVVLEGETPEALAASFPADETARMKVGQLGRLLKALRRFGAGAALMAGQVTPGRLFRGLHPDLKAARILFSLKRRNAETLFGAVAAEIEALGIRLLDARSFLDDHLATPGWMTPRTETLDEEHLRHGIEIATEVARLDIGQGVVVRKGTVLAVEAFEGTDAMLRRAGEFKTDHLIFVKTVKPRQDFRFDVPVFGPTTLQTMHAAGIRTALLKAGDTLILDRPEVLRQAASLKIQLCGF
ncbi:MAG: LpxI family protein [Puniceicoccaceae bacterium]|nr:MAG: LpxI family protein [Puniceicoccaceae bacterium]